MSHTYRPVLWNKNKYWYDAALIAGVVVYIVAFLQIAPLFQDVTRPVDVPIQRMRAFGSCAFLMLTVILCIGPLARLDRRFVPLLYNRRHFGVLTCMVALTHVRFVLGWYFSYSPTSDFVAVLSSNTSFGQLLGFPFELFGIFALLILIVLAVTSHDFWLSFLTPRIWKTLHMGIYFAYAAVVAHVAFGYLQDVDNPFFALVFMGGALLVVVLHVLAGRMEMAVDEDAPENAAWIPVCDIDDIINKRGRVVVLPNEERAAVFRYDGKLSALSNLCAHQNGPLGEGRILYGCVTCPWHGFQYRPDDGRAPAPFTEKLPTYRLKLDGRMIMIDPNANEAGTYVEPVLIPDEMQKEAS